MSGPLSATAGAAPGPAEIEAHFTRADGSFLFARWGRPMAPVVFGVEPESLPAFHRAFAAVAALTGRPLAETDPETGANVLVFLCRDWTELAGVPDLGHLVENLDVLLARLQAAAANQYRLFRFDAAGAIRAAVVFLRMDAHLAALPAEALALAQAVQVALLWGEGAFRPAPPLVDGGQGVAVRPAIAALIRAASDPTLPDTTKDPALALRIHARLTRALRL